MHRLLFIVIGLVGSVAAHAEDSLAIPFGHNLSATSYSLQAGECTVGLQTAACGLSNYFSLGVSPWLWHDYNMISVLARLRLDTDTESRTRALQLGYFKTFPEPSRPFAYEMELFWLYYIHSLVLAPHATLHLNGHAMYYADDLHPFSLRRPWVDRTPLQLNLSALLELHVVGGWYLNGELGILGVAQRDPEYLFAVTVEYRLRSWLFHGGFSQSGTAASYFAPTLRYDYQQALRGYHTGFDGPIDADASHYDFAIHPEFAAQYYF